MVFNQDFATTTSHPPLLLEELEADPLPLTTVIDSVEYFPGTDLTRIVWNVTPSGAEQTAASNVVTAHNAAPLPSADIRVKVKSRSLATPPASPAFRDSYIIAATATGAWVGMEDKVAVWGGDGWSFFEQTVGITAFVADEGLTVTFDSTNAWTAAATKRRINATVAPTVTDDKDSGFAVSSVWVDVAANKAYVCVDSTAGAAVWVDTTATGGGGDPTSDIAEATGDTTTVSTTDVLVSGMTITPASGTYLVRFTGSVDHSANNATADMSIYAGGVQTAASERRFMRGAGQGDVSIPFCCEAKVTVNGSQAIEGRWRTSGATATMHERTLTILKVA